MSDDALHLRMGHVTGHHECRTGGFGLGSDFLYLLHEGAGGVVIGTAPGVQLVVNAAWDAVAADDHLVACRDIRGGVCYQCAPALEVFYGLGIVDEGAEGGHLAALIQQTVGQLDRAVHAEAETRSLCKSDFHCTLLNSTSPSSLAMTERASRHYNSLHASRTACLFSRSFFMSRRPSIANCAAGMGSPKMTRTLQNSFILPSGVS